MLRTKFHVEAKQDFQESLNWYREQSLEAAFRFAKAVEDAQQVSRQQRDDLLAGFSVPTENMFDTISIEYELIQTRTCLMSFFQLATLSMRNH